MSRRDCDDEEVDLLLVQPKGEVALISHHQEHPAQHDPHAELSHHGQETKVLRVSIGSDRSRRG